MPQITKLPNYKHNSIITSLNFHPYKNNVIVSTGLDKTMKLFQIEKENDSYKIKWSSTLIFPDLKDEYKVRVSTSYGKRTGKSFSGTGTVPQSSQ